MGSQQKNASSDGISNNANRKGGRGKGSCQLIWEQAGTPFNILVKMGEGHYIQQELPIESPPPPLLKMDSPESASSLLLEARIKVTVISKQLDNKMQFLFCL